MVGSVLGLHFGVLTEVLLLAGCGENGSSSGAPGRLLESTSRKTGVPLALALAKVDALARTTRTMVIVVHVCILNVDCCLVTLL